jgi:hypothetical protein
MKKEEAISAIRESLSRGSSTPCTWREDRDAYIKEKSDELYKDVIEPIPVTVGGEAFDYGTYSELQGKEIFCIARSGNNWLLYIPELGHFSLAFGENQGSLNILGFSSEDALAEWLG